MMTDMTNKAASNARVIILLKANSNEVPVHVFRKAVFSHCNYLFNQEARLTPAFNSADFLCQTAAYAFLPYNAVEDSKDRN